MSENMLEYRRAQIAGKYAYRKKKTNKEEPVVSDVASLISHRYSKQRLDLLVSRGVDSFSLLRNEHFLLSDNCHTIKTNIFGMRTKRISVAKQISAIEKLLENPLHGNYVLGISGWPSDLRAKQIAIQLMAYAITVQQKTKNKVISSRSLPLWYRVLGGSECALRDKPLDPLPSMLIITNITYNSSNTKMEKVRDLLEIYSDIPRIVVMGSEVDPLSLFSSRLYYPIKLGLFVGPESKVRDISI